MNNISARKLLLNLGREGHLGKELPNTQKVDEYLENYRPLPSFWVALFMIFGAGFGTLLIVGPLFYLGGLAENSILSAVLGIVFVLFAIFADRTEFEKGGWSGGHSMFREYVVLCLMLIGMGFLEIVFYSEMIMSMKLSPWFNVGIGFVLFALVFPFFKHPLGRFFLVIDPLLCFLMSTIAYTPEPYGVYLFNGFTLLLLGGCICFVRFKKLRGYRTLFYAALLTLFYSAVALSFDIPNYMDTVFVVGSPYFLQGTFVGTTVLLILHIGAERGQRNSLPVLAGCVATIVLGMITEPGIIFSLGLMIFARYWNHTVLFRLSILSLTGFLVAYYYMLNMTLYEKSLVLMASGGLLLAGAAIVKKCGWAELDFQLEASEPQQEGVK
ncbi:MAG: DUF4401 domain-containing protein [Desulfovibrio sp.]